jgi:hypothetical protein
VGAECVYDEVFEGGIRLIFSPQNKRTRDRQRSFHPLSIEN